MGEHNRDTTVCKVSTVVMPPTGEITRTRQDGLKGHRGNEETKLSINRIVSSTMPAMGMSI